MKILINIKECQDSRDIGQQASTHEFQQSIDGCQVPDIIINIPAAGPVQFANQIGNNLSWFAQQL